jgi:hypothetical protein
MLMIPHCLNSRLTDGGKVVSPTHRPHSTPQKHFFYVSGTNFCYRLSKPQGLVRLEGLDSRILSVFFPLTFTLYLPQRHIQIKLKKDNRTYSFAGGSF